ncbi:MAG: 4Fe-4S cluster-binding domain-containing protein [Dehalococcoidia bacterium]
MMVNYGGHIPLSTVDFPGIAATTIFLRGCSQHCPLCHNKHLWAGEDLRPIKEIYVLIEANRVFVGGVVISGGEPAEQPEAACMIADYARSIGLKAGLHTSGRPMVPYLYEHFDFILWSPPR